MDLIEKATRIAVGAHATQVRKSDGSPYVVHPLMVARIVASYGFNDTVVASALVHDVLEDTFVDKATLTHALGDDVMSIVNAVSEDKSLHWEERKKRYIEAVVGGGEAVWAVSTADKIHNALSLIDAHALLGTAVWGKFNRGRDGTLWFQRAFSDSLKEVWSHPMLDVYEELVVKLEALS